MELGYEYVRIDKGTIEFTNTERPFSMKIVDIYDREPFSDSRIKVEAADWDINVGDKATSEVDLDYVESYKTLLTGKIKHRVKKGWVKLNKKRSLIIDLKNFRLVYEEDGDTN